LGDIVRAGKVYINILNFDFLTARARLQAAAVEQLLRDGLLDEREAGLLARRMGEYIVSHIEIGLEVPPIETPIPAAFENAFKER